MNSLVQYIDRLTLLLVPNKPEVDIADVVEQSEESNIKF